MGTILHPEGDDGHLKADIVHDEGYLEALLAVVASGQEYGKSHAYGIADTVLTEAMAEHAAEIRDRTSAAIRRESCGFREAARRHKGTRSEWRSFRG